MKEKKEEVQADQARLPWTARLWASIGLPWILVGVISYTVLTVLGRTFLHNPAGLDVLRKEVHESIYDRSSSIFLTALAIDILNIVFERQTIKLDCVLLPAFIKGMASTTNILVRFFTPVIALTDMGRPVVVQRYICWMHTTPSILMLLKMISTTITPRETMTAILFDELMVVSGVIALVTTGWQRVFWCIVTHVAMVPVVPYMHKAFTECMNAHNEAARKLAPLWSAGNGRQRSVVARAMEQIRTRPLQLTMLCIYVLNLLLWCTFAVTWDLALLGWISVTVEEVLYVACDFSAKVLFSSTLMLSSFKEIEARRENAMRVIEGSSKAKLIAELQALLEQKERFMSSVSHELRTPLNGIIGISEGMLSGCCGVLPEGVRRQIYIIRTSGARLLALINDVMDAAALRQNKLVLKQEQVVLRHVVDDVLDLTRSLVDTEVALVNLVPPRMLVVGDTGRIVQILNNLLGNAAKFTRRGQIRVTARQVEAGRKVAVTVSDTGIGIPRNKLATIFLPFEQVDMSISRKYGGFGLGLNIVQELVKAHGGTINVSSIESKGSAFTFTMPLLRAMGRESLEEGRNAARRIAGVAADGVGSQMEGSTSGSGGLRGGTSATVSGVTPRAGGRGPGGEACDDSSTLRSSSDTSRRLGRQALMLQAGSSGGQEAELEQYGELQYNAAELSALGSSRPYAQVARESVPFISAESGLGVASTASAAGMIDPASGAAGAAAAATAAPGERARGPGKGSGAAAAGGGRKLSSTAEGQEAAGGLRALPGGDAKIIHGPKPFHFTMYKRFLLLSVDDDMVNQSVVKSLLGSTGYEVVAMPGGAEALRYVATAPALPDLVLLDCMMPEMDGYEVLQRLRAMTPHVHLPIIMVSAQTEEDHVVCGLDLGADDYVTKPFKRQELLARIRAQLAYGEWEQDEGEGVFDTLSSTALGDLNNAAASAAAGTAAAAAAAAATAGGRPLGGALDTGDNLLAAAESAVGSGPDGIVARVSGSTGVSSSDNRLIVCIDDDDVNQVVLQGMLASQQYRYVRASTGSQGLAYVCGPTNGGIPPDLVLLDCSLPDMTGFDVCRVIRQMYNKQQVPIIMLSARHNESAVVEGLKCGANTYVTKPFRRNELLARIRLHLRSREAPLQRGDSSILEDSGPRATAAAAAALAAGLATAAAAAAADSSLYSLVHSPRSLAGNAAASNADATTASARACPDSAVLVVVVADYAGLCRMLLPAEMAELSGRMLSAFDRAVRCHGASMVEAGSGVMSAAVLPPPPPPQAEAAEAPGGTAAAVAAAGLRLAALHRVGRALLEAAATIPVPGTTTCLQLQQALALGTIMVAGGGGGRGSGGGGAAAVQCFGSVLAELQDLARRAPPMTIVTPDAEAQALRASGATADIRGPLFLEADDGAAAAAAAGSSAAAADMASRRLWLVEVHPLAHQYLPPQLLFAANATRSTFFQQPSLALDDPAAGGGGNGGGPAAPLPPRAATSSAHPAGAAGGSVTAVPVSVQMSAAAGAGGGGGSGGPEGVMGGYRGSASNSVVGGYNGAGVSLGLYTNGAGVSRGVSRAFSHTFGLDSDNAGRTNALVAAAAAIGGGGGMGGGGGTGSIANTITGGTSGNGASQASGPTIARVGGGGGGVIGGNGTTSPSNRTLDSNSGGGITFSLHAAAAAAAVAGSNGAGGGGGNGQHLTSGGMSGVLFGHESGLHGLTVGHGGFAGSNAAAATAGSLLYGNGGASVLASRNSLPPGLGGLQQQQQPFHAQIQPQLDPEVSAAAEPQIRALRNELAAMRQQLEALHSASGPASSAGGGGLQLLLQQQQQQYSHQPSSPPSQQQQYTQQLSTQLSAQLLQTFQQQQMQALQQQHQLQQMQQLSAAAGHTHGHSHGGGGAIHAGEHGSLQPHVMSQLHALHALQPGASSQASGAGCPDSVSEAAGPSDKVTSSKKGSKISRLFKMGSKASK